MKIQRVVVTCPQGIEQLCAYGVQVAESGQWTERNRRPALIGLWLNAQLARAQMRGQIEGAPGAVQAYVDPTGSRPTELLIDNALSAHWQYADRLAELAGATAIDRTDITVEIPAETGLLPLAYVATVAAIAGASVCATWVGAIMAGGANERATIELQAKIANVEATREQAEASRYQDDYMGLVKAAIASGKDPNTIKLSPVAEARLRIAATNSAIRTNNLTAPRESAKKGPFDGLFDDLTLPLVVAAVVGGSMLLRGRG